MKKNIVFIAIGLLSSLGLRAQNWPAQTVHCTAVPTAIVDVTNPATGKTWMDRNLGSSQVATSRTDALAYGDLYQWGRRADGHQCRTSPTTATLSSVDQPTHGDFIMAPSSPFDWHSIGNSNLWQGVNGVNNPCPSGYRIPTEAEFNAERLSWIPNDAAGAYASPLKLSKAGIFHGGFGAPNGVNNYGNYWSSTVAIYVWNGVSGTVSRKLFLSNSSTSIGEESHSFGCSVRCIKD